jgi:hypothetical protein
VQLLADEPDGNVAVEEALSGSYQIFAEAFQRQQRHKRLLLQAHFAHSVEYFLDHKLSRHVANLSNVGNSLPSFLPPLSIFWASKNSGKFPSCL